MAAVAAWLDGRPCSEVPVGLRALHYGDGVFRTALVWDGVILHRQAQLQRLVGDARQLYLQAASADMERQLAALAWPAPRGVVKLCLVRAGQGRGYAPDPNRRCHLLCLFYELPSISEADFHRGIASGLLEARVSSHPALGGIKHLNRLEQVLAARELAGTAWPEAVCRDTAGHPVCGTRSNLFWHREGRLYTPQLEHCGVRGVMRDQVIAAARNRGLPVAEVTGCEADLAHADGLFFSNSLWGILPVAQWKDAPCNPDLALQLRRALGHPDISAPPTDRSPASK